MIDPRAIVDPSAVLGENVTIGPWTTIGPDVEIGDDTCVSSHVIIRGPTRIGKRNRIFQFSSVGEDTPAFAYGGEATRLTIGDDNVIREGVTIHRGTVQDRGETVIGSHNLLMAYVHVGHDCELEDHIVMANNASVTGHVTVGEWANFGGYSGVAQFRRVGAHTHIAAFSLVIKDIPDYVTVAGNPARAAGLNVEGMRRRDFTKSTLQALRRAYKTVYRSGLTVDEALAELAATAAEDASVAAFCESVRTAEFGIIRERE